MNSKTEQKLTYPISLLLSIPYRKTFESLGRNIGISGDTIARLVEHKAATTQDLIKIVKTTWKKRRLYLIIDDTLILKIYSKFIRGTSDNYDSSDGKTYRSLCAVVAVITDGETAIPVNFGMWVSKEVNPDGYKTKWQIAQELVEKLLQEINIYMVLADGLYAVYEFMNWLTSKNIKFEMRFHANRAVTDKDYLGQIKYHPKFKLTGRRPMRTIKVTWKGTSFYVTAFRRVNKVGNSTTVFLVSNYNAPAREHVRAYELRWIIEKFFRTGKQHLGLGDCQSLKINRQHNHIMNVFLIYALLQIQRKKLKMKNIESLIRKLNRYDFNELLPQFVRLAENFSMA
jgi:SRSO17 transposase